MLDSIETASRITNAGGRLIADDFDSSQSMNKALLGLLSGLAEEELDARREGWREARERAIGRGVPNGRAPYGYRKRRDGRLEVNNAKAARLVQANRVRADGVAESELARRMRWSHSTTPGSGSPTRSTWALLVRAPTATRAHTRRSSSGSCGIKCRPLARPLRPPQAL